MSSDRLITIDLIQSYKVSILLDTTYVDICELCRVLFKFQILSRLKRRTGSVIVSDSEWELGELSSYSRKDISS